MRDVFIVDAIRTPIARGRADGALHGIHPVDLLARTMDALVKRAGVDKSQVEDVICGVVTPVREQGANVPRMAALKAGFPETVPGVQLNRMCGSGQQAVHFAAQAIASGDMECVIACGVEMMSVVKMGGDSQLLSTGKLDGNCDMSPVKLLHQGVSAELIAEKWGLTRRELDQYSAQSHEKAFRATKAGVFDSQILPIEAPIPTPAPAAGSSASASAVPSTPATRIFKHDEGIRYPVDADKLGTLNTVFKKNGVVTAGNASQISDGASAVLLCSYEKARELGLRMRAKVISRVVVGSDPVLMLTGVIPATIAALKKANLRLEDIDIFEVNEAFASVVCSWMKELGVDPSKVNPNGGAIAMGHPLGASGAVLMTKLVHELERTRKRYGLQTMCIGFGQATCTIIENLSYNSKL